MTTINAGPYALTAGVQFTVPFPTTGTASGAAALPYVMLVNSSPWALQVSQAGRPLGWLPPWTANVYELVDAANALIVSPVASGTPPVSDNSLYVTWATSAPPGAWPSANPAQALASISGAIASLGVSDTQLVPSPFFFPASTLAPGKLFTIPAGSPSFSNLLIGFETAGGGTAGLANIVVDGDTSGIHYLLATTLQRGEFTTCPFSSVADPTGVRLGVTFPAGGTGTFAVIGQVNPTTVRALIGAKQLSGPTNYAHAITSGVTLVPAGASAQSTIRVWSAWVDIAHTALADGSIQLGAGGTVVFINAQSPGAGGSSANSVSYPGGVPIVIGTTAVILSAGAGSVRGGIAWSVDVT